MNKQTYSVFELKDRVIYKRHKAFFRLQNTMFKKIKDTLYQYNPDTDNWDINCSTRVNAQFVLWEPDEKI